MAYQRSLPTANADSSSAASPTRTGRYNEAYTAAITNKEQFAADEGSHFVAVNPTMGTGIAGHAAATTFDETKALLYIYNGNSAGGARIYLQSVRLTVTVVGVGHTRDQFSLIADTGNRLSSGGTALTKSNLNMDSSNASGAIVTFGAAVLSAATASRRLFGNYTLRGANIEVVWDVFEFVFGAVGGSTGGILTATTVAQHYTQHMPPVVIGPGQGFAIHQWAAAQSTAITFEPVINYIER